MNNILVIKFCLAVEPTSEVLGCGPLTKPVTCLFVAVGAGKGRGGRYTWMNEKAFHLTTVSTRPGF